MKTKTLTFLLKCFSVVFVGIAMQAQLSAMIVLESVSVGTTGHASQVAEFNAPAYTNYSLVAWITAAGGDEDILGVDTDGGFSYDGSGRGQFVKYGDYLEFESIKYASTAELYAVYPLGANYAAGFLYNGDPAGVTGTRLADPGALPVTPGYIVSAVSNDPMVANHGFWDDGKLVLDVAGTYTLSFSQFALTPVFAEVIIRGTQIGDIFVEAEMANLGTMILDASHFVPGITYEGEIDITYGDIAIGSYDTTYDFMRALTTFSIIAVPEPSSFALWAGLLAFMALTLRSRRQR